MSPRLVSIFWTVVIAGGLCIAALLALGGCAVAPLATCLTHPQRCN